MRKVTSEELMETTREVNEELKRTRVQAKWRRGGTT
jgi:ribosomal protein L29|tara:strand:+ start:481 stop:588 length:108 start_codon:yes stop_codon:yes gene_type:complete